MKLFLLRHGVAYEREEWQGDNDELRPLTDDGIKMMKREAKTLRDMELKVDVVVSSPLLRARETAKIAAKALDLKVEDNALLKPGFDVSALGQVLAQYSKAKRLMIVGHEPDFSTVISQLIGGGKVLMDKGGVARLDILEIAENQPLRGELVWLMTPKLLGA